MSKLPPVLKKLALPVIGSPLFIISNPKLVIEQCKAGIVGSMPSLNARPAEQLEDWLAEITETLAAWDKAHPDRPSAPFAINQIVHKSNDRLEHDMAVGVDERDRGAFAVGDVDGMLVGREIDAHGRTESRVGHRGDDAVGGGVDDRDRRRRRGFAQDGVQLLRQQGTAGVRP